MFSCFTWISSKAWLLTQHLGRPIPRRPGSSAVSTVFIRQALCEDPLCVLMPDALLWCDPGSRSRDGVSGVSVFDACHVITKTHDCAVQKVQMHTA